jgi:hypothetical protein
VVVLVLRLVLLVLRLVLLVVCLVLVVVCLMLLVVRALLMGKGQQVLWQRLAALPMLQLLHHLRMQALLQCL